MPLGSVGYVQHLPFFKELIEEHADKKLMFSSSRFGARSSMDINHLGFCYPESYLQEEEFNAGNILDHTIQEIWNSNKWENIRENLDKFATDCIACTFFNYCTKGCMAAVYQAYNCFDRVDPHCHHYYSKENIK